MKLIHYSASPLTEVHSTEQGTDDIAWKPRGLWVSPEGEDDWKHWCEAEGFNLGSFTHATEIILHPKAKLLRLNTPQKLRDFSAKHAFAPTFLSGLPSPSKMCVRWPDIAKRYQGIIIAPYQWRCRLDNDLFWYYSWDCASGCIWDAAAIESLKAFDPCPAKLIC
jgi:hypothetical protein